MIKTLKLINKFFLNKEQKKNILYFFLYSLIIPFLEILSIGTLSMLILLFIDFENSIKLIPIISLQEFFLQFNKILLLKISAFLVFFAVLVKNLVIFLYYYFEKKITKDLVINHSATLFKKHINLPYAFHVNLNSEEVQNDILHQSKNISTYIFSTVVLIKDTMISFVFMSTLLIVNFKASLIIILLAIFTGFLFQVLTEKKIKNIGNKVRLLLGSQIKIAQAASSGIKSIILFTKKDFFQKKFETALEKKENMQIVYEMLQKIPRLLLEVLFILLIVLILILSFNDLNNSKSFLPYLVFLTLVSIRLIPIFSNISVILSSLKYFKPIINAIITNFNKYSDNIPSEQNSEVNDLKFTLDKILVKDLSFSYSNNKKLILENINLQFEKNKIYCLVGETGCGKSTLMDILLGLLRPNEGKLIINNKIELNQNNDYWFGKISYVPQEPFLLNETFKNNICFAMDDDLISNQKFLDAVRLSCLEDVNNQLKLNEDYNIGERGLKLSGGQRQRIGIARALYTDKSFIALDEATSALDIATEEKILKNLHSIKKDKILILITHREQTIKNCDEIISLKNGKIKFVGKPEDYFLNNKS